MRYKKLTHDAMTPRRAHADDAGLDLAPLESVWLYPGETAKLKTGIALEMPTGYVGLLQSRSSTKLRGLDITCIIDAGYRGDVTIGVTNIGTECQQVVGGAYLAQLLLLPCITPELELVDELSESERMDKDEE